MGDFERALPTYLPSATRFAIRVAVVKLLSLLKFDPIAQLVEQRTFNP